MRTTIFSRLIFMLGGVLLVAACSPEVQDSGSANAQAVAGVALDPYLMNATVYIDTNNNAMLDSWEPRALTDEDGYFSVGRDGTDYCADSASENYKYCLLSFDSPRAIIRVIGGYDSVTEEPFSGELSTRMSEGDGAATNVLSPLTTLMSHMSDTAVNTLASHLGVSADQMGSDYFNYNDSTLDSVRGTLMSAGFQTMKTADVIAAALDNNYDAFGDNSDLPATTIGTVMQSIARQLDGQDNDLSNALSDSVFHQSVLQQSESTVRHNLSDKDVTTPAALDTGLVVQVAAQSGDLGATVGQMFRTTVTESQAAARARAIELAAIKLREDPQDSSADEALVLAQQTGFLNSLENGDVDVKNLASAISDGMDTSDSSAITSMVNDHIITDYLPDDIIGSKLSGTNNPDAKDKGGAVFYFQGGSQGAERGELVLCLRFDSANNDEHDTTGARFTGRWSRLNAYTLILDIKIAGSGQSSMLKSKRLDNNGVRHFVFDYNDDQGEWQSDIDFSPLASGEAVPSDDAGCKLVVPEPQ